MYKVEYANLPLHDYINIFNVKRTVLPPRKNFTKEIPAINGEYYMGYKYTPKKISLECVINAKSKVEFTDNLKDLAFILDTKYPSKLIIDDCPDRYNYAVVEGTIDIDKIAYNGKFNLDFICYDPITYSIEPDYFYDDGSHKMVVNNAGTTDAYPIVSVAFTKPAYFLQATNVFTGDTVLVGTPSNVDKQDYTFNPVVLRDNCETLEKWYTVGNIVDDAVVNGSLSINAGGYGIYCNNFGSSDAGWHGGAMRKNLDASLDDFRVRVKLEHNSLGDLNGTGAGGNPPSTSGGGAVDYQCTAQPSLRIREGRGTNYKQIGSIPHDKVVQVSDIDKGWGKVTYNGVTGYSCMDYLRKVTNTSSSADGTYKINATPSLRIRSGRGTNYKQIGSIPNGRSVYVNDISENWGKVNYNGKTGYISMQYAIKQSGARTTNALSTELFDNGSAEENLGRLEVYGFDRNGKKLFKMAMKDTDQWYEYSEPSIEIGSKLVLDDNKKVPAPKTKTEKEGDKDVVKPIESGAFGDWNNFVGWFTVERVTEGDRKFWMCKVEKLDSAGNVSTTLSTGRISDSSFPTSELTNLVIFIGGYKSNLPVEVMNVNEVWVDNLGTPPKPEENVPIFNNGDELTIDFNTQKVYKNGLNFMNELDIGSIFFECPVGNTPIVFRSEDKDMNVITSIQKRWL